MPRTLKAFMLVATISLALPANAEEADEEVVVTATRTRAVTRSLPADVTIIHAENARSRGEATLARALDATPGLFVSAAGGIGQQTSLFLGGANSNHTLVLFDGIRINDPSTPGSSFDAGQDTLAGLARIEIVEGPMSAMFGSDAIGGVINLIPRHGREGALNADLDFSVGSFHALSGAVSVDGALGPLRYALSGEAYASNGHDLVPSRMSTHTGEADGSQMSTLTGVFDLQLTQALSLDLLARHREAKADFDPFIDSFPAPLQRAEDTELEISRNDMSVARLGATWAASESTQIRATLGGMRQRREQADDGLITDRFAGDRRFADFTLTWTGALGPYRDMSVVAGGSYEREEIDVAQGFGFSAPFFFTAADQETRGLFVSGQATIDRMTITGAARLDDHEASGIRNTWRLGASYSASDAVRLYAAYGTSFRAPTLYERFVSFGNPELDAEEARTGEIGAETRWNAFGREDGIELKVLYRASEITNLIDFNSLFTYDNIDAASIANGEAHLTLRPAGWLTARVAYVHTDTEDETTRLPLLRRPEAAMFASLRMAQGPFSGELSYRSIGDRRDEIYGDDGFGLGQGEAAQYGVLRVSAVYAMSPVAQAFIALDNALDEAYEPVNGFAGADSSVLAGVRMSVGAAQ